MNNLLVSRSAGQAVPSVSKFSDEDRACTLDCTGQLALHELLVTVVQTTSDGANVVSAKCAGRFLLVSFGPEDFPAGRPYIDHAVRFVAKTNLGSLNVAVDLRVYPNSNTSVADHMTPIISGSMAGRR